MSDAASTRLASIDALRGVAICLMVAYHFCYDLNWFRIVHIDFTHAPFWLGARGLIVTAFLALVGISLTLARHAHVSPRRYWLRIGAIAGCAALVSLASYVTFRSAFITFGILHAIAVMSILAWPLVPYPRIALALGVVIVLVGNVFRSPLFDTPWLNWVGLVTREPATEDYVPLLPWLGVVLIGITLGARLRAQKFRFLDPIETVAPSWLPWLGRHSLVVYMAHQPILIGMLWLIVRY